MTCWFESSPAQDVLIERNRFLNCGRVDGAPTIASSVSGWHEGIAPVMGLITIRNNHFLLGPGQSAVRLISTGELVLEDNLIVGVPDRAGAE